MMFVGRTFYYLNLLTLEIGTTKCISSDGTVHHFDIAPNWGASSDLLTIWIKGKPVYRILNRKEMCEYVENEVRYFRERLARAERICEQFYSLDE